MFPWFSYSFPLFSHGVPVGFPHVEDLKKLFLKLDADGSGQVRRQTEGPMLRVFAFSWGDHMVLQFHCDISIVFLGLYLIKLCANNSSILIHYVGWWWQSLGLSDLQLLIGIVFMGFLNQLRTEPQIVVGRFCYTSSYSCFLCVCVG